MNPSELWQRAEDLFHRIRRRTENERAEALSPFRDSDPELYAIVRDMLAESSVPDEVEFIEVAASRSESVMAPSFVDVEPPKRIGEYEILREIGRGGMGIVYEARQPRLDRRVALKILRSAGNGVDHALRERYLREARRFVDEATVLGRLDHPGIVPILELNETQDHVAFFTMRLISGVDFREVIADVRAQRPGWNLTRALGILRRACDTLAFAHHHGVLHRDLKPSNLMVGSFGEAYVIDWGLARLGRHEPAAKTSSGDENWTDASPWITCDGDVIGTPAYMSPEQALGHLREMGPWSDVYSLGAILYELLAHHAPHWDPRGANDSIALLERARRRTPPLLSSDRSIPPMLAAICDKAIARNIQERYSSSDELGRDLEAFLTHHVVSAYETGAVAELRMWCVRNKKLAITVCVATLGLLASAIFLGLMNRELTRQRDDVFRLSAANDLEVLIGEVDSLWPADSAHVPQFTSWLARAEGLERDLPAHLARRDALRARALPWSTADREHDRVTHQDYSRLERERERATVIRSQLAAVKALLVPNPATPEANAHNAQIDLFLTSEGSKLIAIESDIEELETRVSKRRTWRFEDSRDAWWCDQLDRLVAALDVFGDPKTGLIEGLSSEHGLGIRRRLELAIESPRVTLTSTEARSAWQRAIEQIADRSSCPAYDGLRIAPQLGLLPLGIDPASGLFEFWHPGTGVAPARNENGRLVIDGATSLVFVLLPGGGFEMGAQSKDTSGTNYDPAATDDEGPVHTEVVPAFFMSKYEMTQAQWQRIAGANPSVLRESVDPRVQPSNPVENVSFDLGAEMMRRLALTLPTEAQWEYACRAGISTPWWCGDRSPEIARIANLADIRFKESQFSTPAPYDANLDDGFQIHAPVGSFPPNRFGIHDIIGNVFEWCSGRYTHAGYVDLEASPALTSVPAHVARGGSFSSLPIDSRCADRMPGTEIEQAGLMNFGLRPCRKLDPLEKEKDR